MSGTWTFFAHWNDADELVLDYHVPGEVDDHRVDDGRWQGGLFSEVGTGADPESAWKVIRAEYEAYSG